MGWSTRRPGRVPAWKRQEEFTRGLARKMAALQRMTAGRSVELGLQVVCSATSLCKTPRRAPARNADRINKKPQQRGLHVLRRSLSLGGWSNRGKGPS